MEEIKDINLNDTAANILPKDEQILVNKLILLFVFEKMEVELSENTIMDICSGANKWINYIDLKQTLADLLELKYVYQIQVKHADPLFVITPEGRNCLGCFFMKINKSIREEVSSFIRQNRMRYKKRQQYLSDYYKNANGTYTVTLRIVDPAQCLFDLKLNIENRTNAKKLFKQWEEKAPEIYSLIYENLIE